MTSDPEDRDADEDSTGTQLDIITAVSEAAANLAVVYTRTEADGVRESVETLLNHTEQDLGYEYGANGRERLIYQLMTGERAAGRTPENGYDGVAVIYDEDGTHPSGVERLIEFVSGDHDVDDVVAESLEEVGDVDAATRVVERLQDEGITVHLVKDDLTVEPGDDHARSLLAAARRASRVNTDADASQLVTECGTGTKWIGGQPPAGFTVSSTGHLQRSEHWEMIRRAAAAVENNDLTLYRAAKLIGHSRHAIRTAMNKYRDLYRVDEADPLTINSDADDEQ